MSEHALKAEKELEQAQRLILKLTADLRQMDQFIYRIANTDIVSIQLDAMREAWTVTHKRMQEESFRIRNVLIPEIVRTYANADTKPQSTPRMEESATPQLAGPRDASAAHEEGRDHDRDSK